MFKKSEENIFNFNLEQGREMLEYNKQIKKEEKNLSLIEKGSILEGLATKHMFEFERQQSNNIRPDLSLIENGSIVESIRNYDLNESDKHKIEGLENIKFPKSTVASTELLSPAIERQMFKQSIKSVRIFSEELPTKLLQRILGKKRTIFTEIKPVEAGVEISAVEKISQRGRSSLFEATKIEILEEPTRFAKLTQQLRNQDNLLLRDSEKFLTRKQYENLIKEPTVTFFPEIRSSLVTEGGQPVIKLKEADRFLIGKTIRGDLERRFVFESEAVGKAKVLKPGELTKIDIGIKISTDIEARITRPFFTQQSKIQGVFPAGYLERRATEPQLLFKELGTETLLSKELSDLQLKTIKPSFKIQTPEIITTASEVIHRPSRILIEELPSGVKGKPKLQFLTELAEPRLKVIEEQRIRKVDISFEIGQKPPEPTLRLNNRGELRLKRLKLKEMPEIRLKVDLENKLFSKELEQLTKRTANFLIERTPLETGRIIPFPLLKLKQPSILKLPPQTQPSILKMPSKLKQKTGLYIKTELIQELKPKVENLTEIETKNMLESELKVITETRLKTDVILKLQLKTMLETKTPIGTTPPLIPKIQQPRFPNKPPLPLLKLTKPNIPMPSKQGAMVYVREKAKGKFRKLVDEPLPLDEALRLGSYIVDNSASATFKVKLTNKEIKARLKRNLGFNLYKFRSYKKRKLGSPITAEELILNKPGTYIEKNINRIDSPGELQGITAKGLMARRKKDLLRKLTSRKPRKMKVPTVKELLSHKLPNQKQLMRGIPK